ncbi:cytochrome c oxidase assembly protein COX14 [Esox lucius]|uniref:C12orf62 homolog n=1 Tax=Esox lucius TaxID=8010 RepID=C1BX50_ESOLU|nr:cytochrome c oxidase assembly protein COX14 [Esox lucius]XP_010879013.1 cytochrome c oxidase assembly protein COX14 [Esox lucius]ACO13603.1 C12orf62 homolog [Esox lucius]
MLPTAKRLADYGYRGFSASMMLLTLYGGYLCTMRGYRYMNKQKDLQIAAENQDLESLKP